MSSSIGKLGTCFFLLVGAVVAACNTQAYCFADCEEGGAGADNAGGNGAQSSTGQFVGGGGSTAQFTTGGGGEGASGPCEETNNGVEVCDDIDNDCNGTTDDLPGLDYNDPHTCGVCTNNCYATLINFDPSTITCTPSDNPGVEAGLCDGDCAPGFYDIDEDGLSCEYSCVEVASSDIVCDNKDDDCDNEVDEDVNLCTSTQDCGKCGGICVVGHGTPTCEHTGPDPLCTPVNTQCAILDCDAGWVDLDGFYITGCEYNCTPTGVEVCGDQLDNDCDGLIDGADDLSNDPQIDQPCFGDPDGICADAAHEGITECLNGVVTCTGADVLFEGDELEVCNGDDDDCDGTVDDNSTDAGGPCGQSSNFPCTFGTWRCLAGGTLDCDGEINPGTETCNGQDDNCDGFIDLVNGMAPMDAMGTCNVRPPPPLGATSPCVAGTKACQGGTVQCVGSVGPTAPTDSCGVDRNCDGVLTNQPSLATDPLNCGSCGNNCNANQAVNHANYTCSASSCMFQACLPGWKDLNGDGTCEYACTFVSAQEACNNQDDDCDGQIDEGVVAPSPKQVCGVSPAATAAECTNNVGVACMNGTWRCTFPMNVCSPTCATAVEVCDGLDNNCNGQTNENVANYNQPCASDQANPGSQGECRRTGNFVCNGPNATVCNAMVANCSMNVGGCTEACDGKDNDCDGSVDEPRAAPGTNATNYYKPAVVSIGTNLWMYQYESSRPNASNIVPGTGNGYFSSSPPGVTQDETPSCSEPTKIPWFNVTGAEADQTCAAAGGFVCSTQQWRNACHVSTVSTPVASDCLFGYGPFGSACQSGYVAGSKFCNLGPSYDFSAAAGDQDGLLVTKSSALQNCYAGWNNVNGNPNTDAGRIWDMTGNLREFTKTGANYTLMGGAFNSAAESGSTCDFTFYVVDDEFKFFDAGFRCCFSGTNPSPP